MDIRVINHGTIVQFMPLTPAGATFLQHELEHEGWQWMGRTLCVDPRYADGVATLAAEHGLEIA